MEHLTEFAGLPVIEFPFKEKGRRWQQELRRLQERGENPSVPPSAASAAWRLRILYGESQEEGEEAAYFARFLDEVDAEQVTALVIGTWGDSAQGDLCEAVELLVEHADALPNLRSLFVGDIYFEECEISWITHDDLAPLVVAFPRLEELVVRGADGMGGSVLGLHVPSHDSLRSLTVQTGGLPGRVTREVVSSGLPVLEHLELWLGVDEYSGDTVPADLAPVLSGEAFPRLRYLGVRNAEKADEWVPVLAEAPLVRRLEVLDLSLGVLTDRGGRELVDRAAAFSGLRALDLHHHFLSEEMVERVRAAFAGSGVEVDLSDRQEAEYRDDGEGYWDYYTAAAE
ncbi:STM4015 family protein [Nocardiopsis halotolerans]|uniref:STM4015 family protein n=1 Tax=Nocardiopsis halotolerans TaxID=124252 RepID=UPI00034D3B6C|nr:STM4015 family protein [Nocardiopsis halotolerans]